MNKIRISQISNIEIGPGLKYDIEDLLYTSVNGNEYMMAQVLAGGVDKTIDQRKADDHLQKIAETIPSVDKTKLTCCYWGYKTYELSNVTLAFYVLPVKDTPYALIITVNPITEAASIISAIVYSTSNIERILSEKDVTIDRYGKLTYKYCRLLNNKPDLEMLYEMRRHLLKRWRRERLLECRLEHQRRLKYLERFRRLRRLHGN